MLRGVSAGNRSECSTALRGLYEHGVSEDLSAPTWACDEDPGQVRRASLTAIQPVAEAIPDEGRAGATGALLTAPQRHPSHRVARETSLSCLV